MGGCKKNESDLDVINMICRLVYDPRTEPKKDLRVTGHPVYILSVI